MFRKASFKEFIECDNPYDFIKTNNAIEVRDKEYFDKLCSIARVPKNLEENLLDTNLLGKKEVTQILKFRTKIVQHLKNQEAKEQPKEEEKVSEDEEDAREAEMKKREKKERQ